MLRLSDVAPYNCCALHTNFITGFRVEFAGIAILMENLAIVQKFKRVYQLVAVPLMRFVTFHAHLTCFGARATASGYAFTPHMIISCLLRVIHKEPLAVPSPGSVSTHLLTKDLRALHDRIYGSSASSPSVTVALPLFLPTACSSRAGHDARVERVGRQARLPNRQHGLCDSQQWVDPCLDAHTAYMRLSHTRVRCSA